MDRERARSLPYSFSVDAWDSGVTDQGGSNRCWAFSGLNMARARAVSSLRLKERNFQLSQNYIFFYDQLEKSVNFLRRMTALRDRPINDPEVSNLLRTPVAPHGEWANFSFLADKYGAVPKSVMPDAPSSLDNTDVLRALCDRLRFGAWELRTGTQEREEELCAAILADVYGILCRFLGRPPRTFDYSYRDRDNGYHVLHGVTPQVFLTEYCGFDVRDYQAIIHFPSDTRPFGRLYTASEKPPEGYDHRSLLNLDMPRIKALTAAELQSSGLCAFGADVSRQGHKASGILDRQLYDLEKLYGAKLFLPKKEQIAYRQIISRHVMTFDGVELDLNGTPLRWKVQNSYGEGMGIHGHYVMDDNWFGAFVLWVVVERRLLSQEERILCTQAAEYLSKDERY